MDVLNGRPAGATRTAFSAIASCQFATIYVSTGVEDCPVNLSREI
jgi:hypothetical protein